MYEYLIQECEFKSIFQLTEKEHNRCDFHINLQTVSEQFS
jgi:hypothetical protein